VGPGFPDEEPHDDDNFGEGGPETDDPPSTLGASQQPPGRFVSGVRALCDPALRCHQRCRACTRGEISGTVPRSRSLSVKRYGKLAAGKNRRSSRDLMSDSRSMLPAPKVLDLLGICADANVIIGVAEEKRAWILQGCGSFLACVRMSCSGDALGCVGWHYAYGGKARPP
jgi:hypothetical protein